MPNGKAVQAATNPAKKPIFSTSDISEALRRYDRGPFLDLLAAWMECAPTMEEISAFAARKPDLWVKALTDLAKIGGYTEKQEVLHTVNVNDMSDSQLEDYMAKHGLEGIRVVETKALPSPIPSKNAHAKAFDGDTIDISPNE